MINHKLFVKNEKVHALITSTSEPNILIPAKVKIIDVKYDNVNPEYLIEVIKFYDNINFLKRYFLNMPFRQTFHYKSRNFIIDQKKIKTKLQLYNLIKERRLRIIIDSIMTVKYEGQMFSLFNKIQNHIIEKNLREIRDISTRPRYNGVYRIKTKEEFKKRTINFIGDKIKDNKKIDFDKYFDML